ncbi:MAG: class I SAM-dependent methyltransferase, partial [Isosphaeraceae bacterium]
MTADVETPEAPAQCQTPRPFQVDFPGFEVTAADTVVDVGCGDGCVCAYAGHQGADVIGIDIDPDCLALADEAMRGVPARSWRGILSDCEPIPLADASASVIVATEVIEHVDDPARLLAELSRIGKPGARYLLSVPDPASEALMWAVAPRWYWEKPYHRHVFEHDRFDDLVRGAGLEIVDREPAGFFWSLWWTFRMALGNVQPYQPTPDSDLLKGWEATWAALREASESDRLSRVFDRLIPKSQVVIARKPAGRSR